MLLISTTWTWCFLLPIAFQFWSMAGSARRRAGRVARDPRYVKAVYLGEELDA